MVGFAALVLAGGGGTRLGGVDKVGIEVGGVTLLERALAATVDAAAVVVVAAPGSQVPTSRPVTWTSEEPPGGGPAAALLAGMDRLAGSPAVVVVLAVDMPRVTAATVSRLVGELADLPPAVDGTRLVDADGRAQPLAAAYRRSALTAARPARKEHEHGLPVRRLLAGLRMHEVPEVNEETRDVDTPDDLTAIRLLHESSERGTLDR